VAEIFGVSQERWGVVSASSELIRVLAVDDHPLLRKGIAALVNAEHDMKLVAEASTGVEAIKQFKQHQPDVTLMDLQMPEMSGIEATIAIRQEFPEARIIVLTTYAGDMQVVRALKAGARGYILKARVNQELASRESKEQWCGLTGQHLTKNRHVFQPQLRDAFLDGRPPLM
jgi:DNA-binding NarL/FixJ family response regulator